MKSADAPWVWVAEPWKCIHVNFAGTFQGKMVFLGIDAHSKWSEIFSMKSTTVEDTIVVLSCIFASCGLTDQLVSGNGPQFIGREFANFVSANGIWHIRAAPYIILLQMAKLKGLCRHLSRPWRPEREMVDLFSIIHCLDYCLFSCRVIPRRHGWHLSLVTRLQQAMVCGCVYTCIGVVMLPLESSLVFYSFKWVVDTS